MMTTGVSKAQAVLAFADELSQFISIGSTTSSAHLPDPEPYFDALPLDRRHIAADERLELDRKGVQIWNACCKVSRDENEPERRAFVAKVSSKPFANALKTAKECITCDLISIASKIIDNLGERQSGLQEAVANATDQDRNSSEQLLGQFKLLRIALACKQGKLDIADHFYTNLTSSPAISDPLLQSKAVDLFYDIGVKQLQGAHHELASKWLGRAHQLAEDLSAEDEVPGIDLSELRLNAMHAHVRALLSTETPEAGAEAHRTLTLMQKDFGHKLAVNMLVLETLSKDPAPNLEAYTTELLKIIRTVHIIDTNHRFIMRQIHHLRSIGVEFALRSLKEYILRRLAPDATQSRTEAAIVTYIWMSLSDPPSKSPEDLANDLSSFCGTWSTSLSPEAAHAALFILWKNIESDRIETESASAQPWCCLALHDIFRNVGERNKAKIQRKLIMSYLTASDYEAAQQIVQGMSSSATAHPLTRYSSYMIALHTRNESAAEAALAGLAEVQDKDNKLLLACVGETVKHGNRIQGALLLQRILDKFNYELPLGIDTCAILRCTARLLLTSVAISKPPDEELLARLCKVFRAAAVYSSKCNIEQDANQRLCRLQECRWFEVASFNAALEHIHSWPSKYVIDLLEHSRQLQYPQADMCRHRQNKMQHEATVLYLQSVLYLSEARSCLSSRTAENLPRTSYHAKEKPDPTRLQDHLHRCVVDTYDKLQQMYRQLKDDIDEQTEEARLEVDGKLVMLIPLAFESGLFLASADVEHTLPLNTTKLTQLINDASRHDASAKTYALIADLVLSTTHLPESVSSPSSSSPIPISITVSLLGKIISAIRSQPAYDIVRAARWIRCVVQVVLDSHSTTSVTTTAHQSPLYLITTIIDEASILARDAAHSSDNSRAQHPTMGDIEVYPSDELEYLSTTLFNLAIDFYVAEKEEEAKTWAAKAVEVADVLSLSTRDMGGDEGALARCLREKGRRVGWTL